MNYYEEQQLHSHTATNNTLCCDRCGRLINGSWIEVLSMKICGVCQWEADNKETANERCESCMHSYHKKGAQGYHDVEEFYKD